MKITNDNRKRFFNNFNKSENGCWNWNKSIEKTGYAHISINNKRVFAHRLSWLIHHGEIKDDLFVLHKCDNRKCVSPKHLFLGTQKENIQDAIKKGRFSSTKNLRKVSGEEVGTSVLRGSEVARIKGLKGKISQHKIAEMFNVSRSAISHILLGHNWKHVAPEQFALLEGKE